MAVLRFSDTQIQDIKTTLQYWAENHPSPDIPIMEFVVSSSDNALSPRQISIEVSNRTQVGERIIEMIRIGTEVTDSLEVILRQFRENVTPKQSGYAS
jgi:hypothetical protein